jgi:hypothetical protein
MQTRSVNTSAFIRIDPCNFPEADFWPASLKVVPGLTSGLPVIHPETHLQDRAVLLCGGHCDDLGERLATAKVSQLIAYVPQFRQSEWPAVACWSYTVEETSNLFLA